MRNLIERTQFRKDIKRLQRSGFNFDKLKQAITSLSKKESLPPNFRNHPLKGDYKGWWECHIAPDWLLIYRTTDTELFLYRTGSHSELFS